MKKNEALILYKTHCSGTTICDNYVDCTLYQQIFLGLMAAEDINFERKIEGTLRAIAESLGVKFKK